MRSHLLAVHPNGLDEESAGLRFGFLTRASTTDMPTPYCHCFQDEAAFQPEEYSVAGQ
jgi:hypothetical protein